MGNIRCPTGGKIALETIRTDSDVKGEIKNGTPVIDVNIKLEANIGEVQCNIDLMKQETIQELEKITETRDQQLVEMALKKAQKEFKSDIFGFGEVLHRSHPKQWRKIKAQWQEKFRNAKVNIHVDAKIRRTGTITDSFQKGNISD